MRDLLKGCPQEKPAIGQGKQDRSGKAIQRICYFGSFNLRLIPSIALEHELCLAQRQES